MLGVLGRGGMGVVVEAHDAVLDRSVALKLLSASAVRRGQLRMLREAQALARLSHPNVVQVYDVGDLEGQTFIAMELVRGRTLRAWGRDERRPWRTTVAVYLQAARGLAAAHDKGLVHRDFKPENCIIDDEGRVRVLDFGLAREITPSSPTPSPDADDPGVTAEAAGPGEDEDEDDEGDDDEGDDDEGRSSNHVLAESLTRPGVLMGTLGYMAFEQLQGRPADAYSDQYAFCVSLYEALYGVAPYPGGTPSSLFAAMFADKRQPTPPGIAVPRRLSRALWQGLSREPAKRWPSMRALIAELEALSRSGRSRALVAALGVGIAGVATLAFMRDAPDPCPDVATALAGTWDADARARVEHAFAAHGPDDPSLLPRLVDRLDGYANAWATMTRESCEATFVVRRQSEAQLEQRTRCLERRRNRLVATIDAFADAADDDELSRAVVLPFRLPPLDPCDGSSAEVLEPVAAAHDERHARVRREIDEAATLWEAGRVAKGSVLATAALAQARELDEAGLVAEALEVLARLQTDAGELDAASVTLEAAVVAASAAGDDTTATRAWLGLVFVSTMRGRHARAAQFVLSAKAALARKDDAVLRSWLLNNQGILAAELSLPLVAREGFEQSLALKQAALGPDHVDVGIALQNIGGVLVDLGAYGEALVALERAREIFLATLGDSHPWHGPLLLNVCRAERARGRPSDAIAVCEGLLDRLATQSNPALEARVRFSLAEALWDAERHDEALATARRAIELGMRENPQLMTIWTRWIEIREKTPEIYP